MQGVGDPAGGFLRRLQQELAGGAEIFNAGIGGNTTRDMLARLPAALERRPFDVVMLLGCNDLPRERDEHPQNRVALPEYRANLQTLLAKLKSPRSLFVSSFLPSASRTGVQLETFELYMGVALETARAAGYEIWDLFHEVLPFGEKYLAEDGMHFAGEGHAFLARGVGDWWVKGLAPESRKP